MFDHLEQVLNTRWQEVRIRFVQPWEQPFVVSPEKIDFYELYFLEYGSGIMQVEEKTFHLEPGQVLFFRTWRYNSFSSDKPFRFMVVTLTLDGTDPQREALDAALEREKAAVLSPVNFRELLSLIYSMQNTYVLKNTNWEFKTKLLLGKLTDSLFEQEKLLQSGSLQMPKTSEHYVSKVITYLQEHYSEKISLKLLGELTGLQSRYLCSLFSRSTGRTISETLTEIRLRQAQRLLISTDNSIMEVGLLCGLGNAQSFSRSFSKAFGLSPREYRKANRMTSKSDKNI